MSLLISGCKSVDEYVAEMPITQFRVPHFTGTVVIDGEVYYKGACSIRTITNKRTLDSYRARIGGLSECNGAFGLVPVEFSETRVWISELK